MVAKRGSASSLARHLKLALAFVAAIAAAPALAQETVVMGKGEDISTMCGDKPTIVGLADGFGGNTWRKEVVAELKAEAAKCKNITQIIYTDGTGDPAKANSDINSLVAQGVNVLIIFPDFGEASLPALRAAVEAGVVVVPYNATLKGEAGVDFSFNVFQDHDANARQWATWLQKNVSKGTLLYFSGPAGNSHSVAVNASIKKALAPYPDIKILEEDYIATNWNPAETQKATAGVIAKYGRVDIVVTDLATVTMGILRTFEQANLPLPAVVNLASNNELNCYWLDLKKEGKAFPYISLDGTTLTVRHALRRGMAAYQGTENKEPLAMEAFVYADSFGGINPACNKDLPLDADLSGMLTSDELKAVFAQ